MRFSARPRQARSLGAEKQHFVVYAFLAFLSGFELCQTALANDLPYSAASQAPRYSESRSADFDATAPGDEPQSGKTEAGTPVNRRVEACFPAETRNVYSIATFWCST